MTSIWMGGVDMPHFPSLQKDIKTDVLIIGGGMAGILCAYFLKEQGVDYTLWHMPAAWADLSQTIAICRI